MFSPSKSGPARDPKRRARALASSRHQGGHVRVVSFLKTTTTALAISDLQTTASCGSPVKIEPRAPGPATAAAHLIQLRAASWSVIVIIIIMLIVVYVARAARPAAGSPTMQSRHFGGSLHIWPRLALRVISIGRVSPPRPSYGLSVGRSVGL